MSFCSNCGAPLAEGVKFCAQCGTAVAATLTTAAPPPSADQPTPNIAPPATRPAATPPRGAVPPPVVTPPASSTAPPRAAGPATHPTQPAAPKKNTWWIVPAVIVGLIVIVFVFLIGMPFGRDDKIEREQAPLETVLEGPATQPSTATLVETSPTGTDSDVPQLLTEIAPPVGVTQTLQPNVSPTQTQPPQQQQQPSSPTTTAAAREGELSEREAAAILRTAAARHYDDVGAECIELRSHGYVNRGYTMTVWNSCADGGIRMLGRWRVDSEEGEVFRQRENGKYLAP